MKEGEIVVKVEYLVVSDNRVLAGKGRDRVENNTFYRVLGGSLNFGETAEEGMRREIREELRCEIDNLQLADVFENIFTYESKRGHEIVFLFKGDLSEQALYGRDIIHIIEDENDYKFDAEWISIDDVLNKKIALYPEWDYSRIFHRP